MGDADVSDLDGFNSVGELGDMISDATHKLSGGEKLAVRKLYKLTVL
jgi:hypothetical protein